MKHTHISGFQKKKKTYHNLQSYKMEVKNTTKLKQKLFETFNDSTVPVTKDMQFYLLTVAIWYPIRFKL